MDFNLARRVLVFISSKEIHRCLDFDRFVENYLEHLRGKKLQIYINI